MNCPKCEREGLQKCACTVAPDRPRIPFRPEQQEPDVYIETHGRYHFRLVAGFNLLKKSER
jgi:hypothetical protein